MGGLTGAVHWWEEWQLRVLVLSSLAIQFFLLFYPSLRRRAIPGWFRFIMWLAYHGGDAIAIYALATLFNRHKDQGDEGGSNTLLEVVWAPVLLIHLGGSDGVTAYNIEDNELWTRHLLTAVSQVTVAVYVFCKSWPPGSDKKLLAAAILLFVVGVGECFFKAWAFKRASIYSLVSSAKQENDGSMYNKLEEYVKDARDAIAIGQQQPADHHEVQQQPEDHQEVKEDTVATTSGPWTVQVAKDEGTVPTTPSSRPWVVEMMKPAEGSSNHSPSRLRGERAEARNNNPTLIPQDEQRLFEERGEASKLYVDLSSSNPRRISIFAKFWGLSEKRAYDSVQRGLASAFFLLYTKQKSTLRELIFIYEHTGNEPGWWNLVIRLCIQLLRIFLPWASIAIFHHSHREAYNDIDVKVTYALLCCTAALEYYSSMILGDGEDVMYGPRHGASSTRHDASYPEVWPKTVAQYNLAGYFVRNKKHSDMMRMVSFVGCKDLLDQYWCMEPCFSSGRITSLVLRYLKDGWTQKIQDAATYRSFNNHSSHWGFNMNRPFDECVLLWHLATDFCCFFSSSFPDHKCAFAEPPAPTPRLWRKLLPAVLAPTRTTSRPQPQCSQESAECKPVQCRQMSNYMVYLLFVNPEMLLPGTRRNIFQTAYGELEDILRAWDCNSVCWSRCTPCGVRLVEEEAIVMDTLITVMKNKTEKRASQEGSSVEGSNRDKSFIDQAWTLAQRLLKKDEMKMWKEIQDVWVEMLCFSASRCRGYLHAKALGKGGEFLSYVWLLLFYMGMETFSDKLQREPGANKPTREVSTSTSMDRLQREQLPSQGGNQYGAGSTSEISEVAEDVV